MAFEFKQTPTATVQARSSTSSDTYKLNGINSSMSSATNTAVEVNKILAVFGMEISADEYMKLTITKDAEEDE